jgi:hypothetical protein
MALLGEPMEKLSSKAKGLCAIVIEDEDFKSIDASVLQANPLSGTPSATWSAITMSRVRPRHRRRPRLRDE